LKRREKQIIAVFSEELKITYQFSTQKFTHRLVDDLFLKEYPNESENADGTGKHVAVELKIKAD